jgi:putative transposase
MRFSFILAEKAHYPIDLMCRVLEVSRSGFYAWLQRAPSARAKEDTKLLIDIRICHAAVRGAYGSPRIFRELRRRGWRVSRKRVARLMAENGLFGRKRLRFRKTTLSDHQLQRFDNVLGRQFNPEHPNEVWAGDITYLWTRDGGWLYLAVVIDLYSRKVVGWAIADHMREELVVKALDMAIASRPAPKLFHSDQGSQYASFAYQSLLRKHGIKTSMSRRGDCWDNGVPRTQRDRRSISKWCSARDGGGPSGVG